MVLKVMAPMVDNNNSKFKFKPACRPGRSSKLVRVWLKMAGMTAQSELLTSAGGFIFLFGKILRFILFIVFLRSVVFSSSGFSGYLANQVIVFFLVFNLIDIFTQFLFRGVYQFRNLIVSGDYDLDLLKPLPSFYRPLFGWADPMDGTTLVILLVYFPIFIMNSGISISLFNLLLFIFFVVVSLVLAFSLNLIICAICILTTEIDHLIWIYRDLTNMARVPMNIYPVGIRFFLTFVIPIVVLISIPAQSLIGLLSFKWGIVALAISGVFFVGSLKFWRYALARYSSASS